MGYIENYSVLKEENMGQPGTSEGCTVTPGMTTEELRQHAGEATRLLKALANESRLMIMCNLAEGEMTVGQLNGVIPLSQSALSQHLALLRRDGLVKTRREAQTIYYSLIEGPASQVIQILHDIYCPSLG
jgi:DNA-binding transcriptional ArsR family regulator